MEDNRFHSFSNCEVLNVWKKCHGKNYIGNTYLIEIAVRKDDSVFPEYINIKVDGSDIYKQLLELMSDESKRERVYLAYGMADIDIVYSKSDKKYCIEWSPNEASYNYFYFEEENFVNNLVNSLEPYESK